MGFFDDIYCDMPLPDGYVPKRNLQTKDFDPAKWRATVSKPAGSLVKETYGVFNSEPMLRFDCGYHGIIRFLRLRSAVLRSEVLIRPATLARIQRQIHRREMRRD